MVVFYSSGMSEHFGLNYHEVWRLPFDVFLAFCTQLDRAWKEQEKQQKEAERQARRNK